MPGAAEATAVAADADVASPDHPLGDLVCEAGAGEPLLANAAGKTQSLGKRPEVAGSGVGVRSQHPSPLEYPVFTSLTTVAAEKPRAPQREVFLS